jgi:hypothetical protein
VVEESSAFKDEIIGQFRQLLKQAGEQGHTEEIEEEVMRKTLVQDAIDNALVDLIVMHNLPYRLVEWPEFHTFCMTLNPQAIDCLCRAHSTIPRVLTEFNKLHLKNLINLQKIQKSFLETQDIIRKKVQSAVSSIHLSVDIWTSPDQRRHLFLAVVAHFTDA